ncbi:MAG: hypothetical protein AAF570_29285 [Bacteroidota bacterium]
MLRKIFPFLFKSKGPQESPAATSNGRSSSRNTRNNDNRDRSSVSADTPTAEAFGIVARNKNHRGLRKGSKVYVRQILDDGQRLRVRGTAPNGKKVTLSVNRLALKEYQSELIPAHLTKHYNAHSQFADEHEAKVKAEMFNKR